MSMQQMTSKEEREQFHQELVSQGFAPLRCSNCGRFLGYERIVEGAVLLRCHNCKAFNEIVGTLQNGDSGG